MKLLDIEPGTYFFVPSLDPQKTREEVMHAAYSERVQLSTIQPAGVFNGVYGVMFMRLRTRVYVSDSALDFPSPV